MEPMASKKFVKTSVKTSIVRRERADAAEGAEQIDLPDEAEVGQRDQRGRQLPGR